MKYASISACLCGFLLVCLNTNAGAKPISSGSNSREDGDPLLALPSEGHQQSFEQQAPQQEVRYVAVQPQSRPEHQASASAQYEELVVEHQSVPLTDQHQHQAQQQVVYNQYEQQAPYQLIQVAAHPAAGHEYSSPEVQQPANVQVEVNSAKEAATGGEYPGEIVYVGSNGQTSDENSLAAVADSLQQNSGLAATILTEVPVKHMPYEVLEKLKREYGVKVVATRERPGANLVINCDDHWANREKSVCNKQSRYAHVAHEQHYHFQPLPIADYHTLEPSEHEHEAPHQAHYQFQPAHLEAHEEPQHRSQPSQEVPVAHGEQLPTYATTGPNFEHQPHVRSFSHRGVMEEVVEQPAEPEAHPTTVAISEGAERQQQQHASEQDDHYGSRTATTAAVSGHQSATDETQPRREAEPTAQAQQAPPSNQNEPADQQGGFDEQPKQLEGEQSAYRQ